MANGETAAFGAGRYRARLEVARGEIALVLDDREGDSERATLPYPSGGYGGHEMVVSPDQQLLALFLYSGQSEVGYELFSLSPELRHIGGMPYVFGEGEAPVFSDDGRWIALASAIDPNFSGDDAEGDVIDWAEVRVQALPAGPIAICRLRVVGAEERDEACYLRVVRFASSGELVLSAPPLEPPTLALPLPESITLEWRAT